MSVIVYKQGILSNDFEETNKAQLEEEIYQQMNLSKLEDLNILPLEEIRKILDKKFEKKNYWKKRTTKLEKNST